MSSMGGDKITLSTGWVSESLPVGLLIAGKIKSFDESLEFVYTEVLTLPLPKDARYATFCCLLDFLYPYKLMQYPMV